MIRTELRSYQREAVDKATPFSGFAFFGEQRTGKTLPSLTLVDMCKPDICIIFCRVKGIREWREQIAKHLKQDWKCQFMIHNFEEFRSKKRRRIFRWQVRKWRKEEKSIFTICDEAHRIKRRGSIQSRMVRSVGHLSHWRLALTGTPIAQGLQDAWAIFDFVERGHMFWEWENFEDYFLIKGGFRNKKVVGYRHKEEFYRRFHARSHRITLREAKKQEGAVMPKICRTRLSVPLAKASRRIYQELEGELRTVVNQDVVKVPLVLSLTMKLQQVAGGFLLNRTKVPGRRKPDEKLHVLGTEKLRLLGALLESRLKGQKVIICARFIHEIEYIAREVEYRRRTYKIIAGGHEFDGKFDCDVILLQIQSGESIDLSMASTYVFYSWDFSYINYEQSKFRIMSFATRQVNYIYLIAEGTVDEDIYEAVVRKRDLATLVCDKYRRKNVRRSSAILEPC